MAVNGRGGALASLSNTSAVSHAFCVLLVHVFSQVNNQSGQTWGLGRARVLLVDFWVVRETRLRVLKVLCSHHVGMHRRTLPLPAKVLRRVRSSQKNLKGYWLSPTLRVISMLRSLRLRGRRR